MKQLLLFIIMLFALGCESNSTVQQDVQQQSISTVETDPCEVVGSQFNAAGLEFGTNSYKGRIYVVDISGRNRSIRRCDKITDESWSSTLSYDDLARNAWHDVQTLQKECGNNIFGVVSRGFQNTYDIPAFKAALTRNHFDLRFIKFLTGAEEAKLEWRSLSDADPNCVVLGTGGGSLQLGSSQSGISVPIGSLLSESKSESEIKQIVKQNPFPDYMRTKDYVMLTGGSNYLALCITSGQRISAEDGIHFTLPQLRETYELLNNSRLYTTAIDNYGLSDIEADLGLSRQGVSNALYATILYLEDLRIEDIRLAPHRSWLDTYVREVSTPPGYHAG